MKNFSKKLISLALSATMISGCFVSSALCASAVSGKYGDVNNDGKVNSSDALKTLKSSVGSVILDADELLRADVNNDKRVNSSDALLILKYSTGSINSFPVEESTTPATANEILKVYSDAVNMARTKLPSYIIEPTTSTDDVDAKISGITATLLFGSKIPEMEAQMEADMITNQHYRQVIKQGSDKSLSNFLSECKLQDAGELQSISLTKNDIGNYVINIKFKDEKNSKTDTSPIIKVLGVPDYDETKKSCEDSLSVEGFEIKCKTFSLDYINCYLSCEINPTTGEFVKLTWQSQSPMEIGASIVSGVNVDMKMKMNILTQYTDFGY